MLDKKREQRQDKKETGVAIHHYLSLLVATPVQTKCKVGVEWCNSGIRSSAGENQHIFVEVDGAKLIYPS